ncbi:phosphatase [Oscillatoriales cyanobacterium USR001]|nr:phosphatase [Oscillatoriales cyanobacterium USR001]
MLELHCHTTYSDGKLTPAELVKAAAALGVKALAITDHDTLSGWDEALSAAADYNLEIVPGLELSTIHYDRSLHILGFYPNPEKLREPLRERLEGRMRRSQQMIDKLTELGYPIKMPKLGEGMAPGRPHIAAELVKAGYATSNNEAFDRWLGDGKPAYVNYENLSIVEGIDLLRNAGAVSVWAHPYLFRGGNVEAVLKELVDAGLMGVEVYHPGHSSSDTRHLKDLCKYYGLLITGGSDYHGPDVEKKSPDQELNMFHLPLDLLTPIKLAANFYN